MPWRYLVTHAWLMIMIVALVSLAKLNCEYILIKKVTRLVTRDWRFCPFKQRLGLKCIMNVVCTDIDCIQDLYKTRETKCLYPLQNYWKCDRSDITLTVKSSFWAMFSDHLRSNGTSGQIGTYHILLVWHSPTIRIKYNVSTMSTREDKKASSKPTLNIGQVYVFVSLYKYTHTISK
jgi:hypothetical protein